MFRFIASPSLTLDILDFKQFSGINGGLRSWFKLWYLQYLPAALPESNISFDFKTFTFWIFCHISLLLDSWWCRDGWVNVGLSLSCNKVPQGESNSHEDGLYNYTVFLNPYIGQHSALKKPIAAIVALSRSVWSFRMKEKRPKVSRRLCHLCSADSE